MRANILRTVVWGGLLLLIILRPFLCGEAYAGLDIYYRLILISLFLVSLTYEQPFHRNSFKLPILLLLAVSCISIYKSFNLHSSVSELYKLVSYLIILCLIMQISKKQASSIITVMIIAACLVSLRGIYQYFFGLGWTMEYLNQAKYDLSSYQYAKNVLFSKRAFSTFFSPDMLAGYLAMVIPLSGGFLLDNLKSKKKLVMASIFLFIISICIGLTKSIGGWLSLFAGSIIFFILFLKEMPHLDHKKVIKLAAIVLTVIILIITATVIKRADQFIDFTNPQNSILQRLYYWKSALKMIRDFPLTGIGWGNFGTAYARYKLLGANEIRNAHNSYLQIWAETGPLGIIAIAWFIFIFFREGLQGLKEPGEKGLKIGLIAAGFSFLTHNLIDYDYYISQVSFHWWIILGLTLAIRGKNLHRKKPKLNPLQFIIKYIIAILLLAIATLMVRSHLATLHFENGLSLFRDNKNDEAIIELKKAQTLDFKYDLYHLALAKNYERKIEQNNLGPADPLFGEVIKEYQRAINLNSYYPFHYRDLGLFFLKHNMIKEAFVEFKKAVYFYPTNPDLHNYLRMTHQKLMKEGKPR